MRLELWEIKKKELWEIKKKKTKTYITLKFIVFFISTILKTL